MSSSVERVSLIYTALERRGNGHDNPIRIIEQYWTDAGDLVAEKDVTLDQFVDELRKFVATASIDTARVFKFDGRQITVKIGDSTK